MENHNRENRGEGGTLSNRRCSDAPSRRYTSGIFFQKLNETRSSIEEQDSSTITRTRIVRFQRTFPHSRDRPAFLVPLNSSRLQKKKKKFHRPRRNCVKKKGYQTRAFALFFPFFFNEDTDERASVFITGAVREHGDFPWKCIFTSRPSKNVLSARTSASAIRGNETFRGVTSSYKPACRFPR